MIGPATRALFHLTGAAIGACAVLFALAVWRLSAGPISLAFLAPYVEEALSADDRSFRLSFDDLVLTWAGWERTLDIRALGVQAHSTDAVALAGVPEMAIALSVPALTRGLVAPTRLDVFGPGVRLVRRAGGGIDLGFAGEGGEGLAARLVRDLLRSPDPTRAMGYLKQVNIIEARLAVRDERLGVEWTAPSARLALERHESGIRAAASLDLEIKGEPVEVTASALYESASGRVAVGVAFDDVRPPALAAMHPDFAALERLDLPLGGRFDLVVDADGALAEASFALSGGVGVLRSPPLFPEGTSLSVAGVTARGRLEDDLEGLALDELAVDFGGPTLSLSGRFTGEPEAPDTLAELKIGGVPVSEVATYWPAGVASGGRDWVVAHMDGGVIDEMTITMALAGEDWPAARLPAETVQGRFRVSDTTVTYHPDLPPAVQVDATGSFDPTRLDATIMRGRSGPLAAHGGSIRLRDLDETNATGEVEIAFSGLLGATLAVLDSPPFGYAKGLGLEPEAVGGGVEGTLTVGVPLVGEASLAAMSVAASADLHSLSIAHGAPAAFGGKVTDGEAALLLDNEGFDLTGDARLDGVPVALHWRENFDPVAAGMTRRIDLMASLDGDERARLGVGNPRLRGTVDVELRMIHGADGRVTGELDADAEAARLALPSLGWEKPPGVAAKASATLEWEGGSLARIPRFGVRAAGLSAIGSASRERGGWTIAFDRLAAGMSDVQGSVRVAEGGLGVALAGASLDMRPFLSDHRAPALDGETEAGPPLDLDAAVDMAVIDDRLFLSDLKAKAAFDGRQVRKARFDFALGQARDLSFRLAEKGGRRVITLTSADAGAVFDALDIAHNMVGGALSVEAVINDSRPDRRIEGVVGVDDFHVVDGSTLAKLLSIASITGPLELLQGKGLPFARLEAPFVYRDRVLTLSDARAWGISLGFTLDGDIDLDRDRIDVTGTIVPAYALNSVLGKVPVIGGLLTGGEGKGVFAATYSVEGPRADPKVVVNPLAALAPGILRELFSGIEPAEAAPPQTGRGRVVR